MEKTELVPGDVYIVRHHGTKIRAQFTGLKEHPAWKDQLGNTLYKRTVHMMFLNLSSNRMIEIKSTAKVLCIAE